MSGLLDNLPGPAGLYLDRSKLTPAAAEADRQAAAVLERWCISCGQPARFGFGCYALTDGLWACSDPDCRAFAERHASSPHLIAAE